MQGQDALLLQILGGDKLHVGMGGGRAECRRVGGIVLLALLHEWSDGIGRYQLHIVSEASQHAGPMMSRPARLQYNRAGLLLCEERDNLVPSQLALDLRPSGLIHSMHLENGL